ncbi:hypothetical protein WMY93_025506 [Mugilogobius chulae]|uniref:Uncharacterized protein n=1 Tax=Mugilogobius chulae TaxID=88201 RepID=A0AAW0MZ27_9GOBI
MLSVGGETGVPGGNSPRHGEEHANSTQKGPGPCGNRTRDLLAVRRYPLCHCTSIVIPYPVSVLVEGVAEVDVEALETEEALVETEAAEVSEEAEEEASGLRTVEASEAAVEAEGLPGPRWRQRRRPRRQRRLRRREEGPGGASQTRRCVHLQRERGCSCDQEHGGGRVSVRREEDQCGGRRNKD